MSETKWSPTPWVVSRSTRYFKDGATVVRCNGNASSGVVVCAVTRTPGEVENARLIAAAPDLYRELDHLVSLLAAKGEYDMDVPGLATLNGARNALAKARGES